MKNIYNHKNANQDLSTEPVMLETAQKNCWHEEIAKTEVGLIRK